MNRTKKLMLVAGILFQLGSSLYADNWSDAFLIFGGGSDAASAAQAVLANIDNPNAKMTPINATKLLSGRRTDEALAIARLMVNGKQNQFNSSFSQADVEAAAQAVINATRGNVQAPVVNNPAPVVNNPAPVVNNPAPVVNNPANVVNPNPTSASGTPAPASSSSSWSNWFGGSSDNSAAIQQAVQAQQQADMAAMQQAVKAQQQADALAAQKANAALVSVAQSGAQGADLYNAYIDLIFASVQQAVASIMNPAVQQQVVQYVQSKSASMKFAASQKSPTLGRFSSKKAGKKSKAVKNTHAIR